MNIRHKKSKIIISCTLSMVLLCAGTGILAYAAGTKADTLAPAVNEAEKAAPSAAAANDAKADKDAAAISKDETVYVIAGADGSAKKIIVSDWIKNSLKQNTIHDTSELTGITNVKGDESYTMDSEGMQVWDAQGNDIYYQGNIEKELPVDVDVSYLLNGSPISAEDLAGKSGNVTIRFDYTNKQYENVEINGVQTKINVPFIMLTGMILDNDHFSNIQVTNGKIINDGDHTTVLGIALPGMQENLNVDSTVLDIPDYVEINADVSGFELTTTLTLAENDIFNHLNLTDVDSLDSLSKSTQELSDAMSQLMDGSSALYDGLSALLDKSGELTQGIDKLTEGANKLSNGTDSLKDGSAELSNGIEDLSNGLHTLASNNQKLDGGARQTFEALLSMADSQLSKAGLTVDKLTIDNYQTVLDGLLKTLNEDTVYDTAYNTALTQVTKAVRDQEAAIRSKVEAAVQDKVLEGILAASGQSMTAGQYQTAVKANKISPEIQSAISAALNEKMKSDELQTQIDQTTQAQIKALISQNMKSDEVTSKINAAVNQAKTGKADISALKAQLDSYNEFYQGLITYTAGVKQADSGAGELLAGSGRLAAGASELSDGADTLSSGLNTLKEGSSSLIDGVTQLKDGAMQLSDGLTEFNEKGIQKLIDALDGDLNGLITRIRATADVSKDYNSFSGISDDMTGSVKFIYRTDSIEK